jgi:1,4-dihydroxy-2-naphthoate polyprenyltransferase
VESPAGQSVSQAQPGLLSAWWLALRPWSFSISLAPVIVATGLAGPQAQVGLAMVALLACLFIHAGTNLQNDVGDFRRGADRSGRLGPPRATTEGWLTARQVQAAATLCFALAVIPGAYLAVRGGWLIVAIGVASIAAGAAYTAGPRPVAYSGWGEAFVIVFFGFIALGGMYYLHTGTVSLAAVLAGAAVGLLAAAVLVVNNLRDIDSDRSVGKYTLAVRLGRRFAVREYAVLLLAPFVLSFWMGWFAPLLLLPWAIALALRVRREPVGAGLNAVLASTASLGLAFAVLLSLGALVQV